jgi:ribosomal protein S18 acetylase RimI-like enzyme
MCGVEYASEAWFASYYAALDSVAKERIYIEMVGAPPFEKVLDFQRKSIENDWPNYYAVDENKVVGWADITPFSNPRLAHRASLGMGLIASHRGQGLGSQLLDSCLWHATRIGLEKVELYVYTQNDAAIHLYRKFGFKSEGLIKHYRRLDGCNFDCLMMAKSLANG